jgi:hypothetical protein
MANLNHTIISSPSDTMSASPGLPPPTVTTATQVLSGLPRWASRPVLASQRRERSRRARQKTRWQTRIEAVTQDLHCIRVANRHDLEDGDLDGALEAALEENVLNQTPLSAEETQLIGNRGYAISSRPKDVALFWRGKLVAAVLSTPDGPVVHRFVTQTTR